MQVNKVLLNNNTKIGYARISTYDQDLKMQLDALLKYGCKKQNIFTDKVSGAKKERPGLNQALEKLQSGDMLVVWRLDRLGRTMSHLIDIINRLKSKRVGFKSLCDIEIDTTTASGEFIFNIFSSLAHFERKLLQERTKAGLNAARARGRLGGRRKILSTDPKVLTAIKMHKNHKISIYNICKVLRISRATFYRYLVLGKQ